MKICNSCKQNKEYSLFNKNKRIIDGYAKACRKCMKEINSKSYINNKEKCNIKSKNYYKDNKEYLLKIQTEYGKNNPEVRRKATAKYLKKNPEYYNQYRRNRYHTDPQFKLRLILGNRLNEVLKKNVTFKTSNIIKLLGCSLNDLKYYIETQFKPEMNWDNHGTYWEVDHILPCDSFNLIDIEQQKQCFHYTNLQPLTKVENRIKSNKNI
jgi:hypothetical protein